MINYPNLKKIKVHDSESKTTHRGMALEKDINDSNAFYREINRAVIHKKPTPVQIVRVDYPKRSSAKIIEAYYKTPSTTDYNGLYRGKYLDFEAKETRSKSIFSFKNIHQHQIDHLIQVMMHDGIAFFILRFCTYNETYLIDARLIVEAYKEGNEKSISYKKVKENGYLIQESYTPRLKYLDIVDNVYFKEEQYGFRK